MVQNGQVFELESAGADGATLWAYRYRTGGRGSKRVQRGFISEDGARRNTRCAGLSIPTHSNNVPE